MHAKGIRVVEVVFLAAVLLGAGCSEEGVTGLSGSTTPPDYSSQDPDDPTCLPTTGPTGATCITRLPHDLGQFG